MRQALQTVLMILAVFCVFPAIIAPAMTTESDSWRWGVPAACVGLAIALTVTAIKIGPKDLAPDFLGKEIPRYFDCEGFCFGLAAKNESGICSVLVLFQNRYEKTCQGRIALRPAQGFFLSRAKLPIVGIDIVCPPGGFGIARIPWPMPAQYQGTKQRIDVGAAAEYPEGKGKKLRFGPGMALRPGADFQNSFGSAVGITITGSIAIRSPASVTLQIPTGVAEELPESALADVVTLWKLGDPVNAPAGQPAPHEA